MCKYNKSSNSQVKGSVQGQNGCIEKPSFHEKNVVRKWIILGIIHVSVVISFGAVGQEDATPADGAMGTASQPHSTGPLDSEMRLDAKETPTESAHNDHKPIPLAITINGGVSLGAYEAGYLFYLVEFLKKNQRYFDPQIITGASAGTLNAVLTLLAVTQETPTAIGDSLFFRIWTSEKMNYDNVMDIGNNQTLHGALSSRSALGELVADIRTEWNRGFSDGRKLYLGVSTTKLIPQEILLENQYRLIRQEEKFVLSVSGCNGLKGESKAPKLEMFNVLDDKLKPPKLSFEGDPFDVIRDLVYASSAFPLVFLPQRLKTVGDTKADTTVSSYIDGGMFDNNPLRLAYKISEKREYDSRFNPKMDTAAKEKLDKEYDHCLAAPEKNGTKLSKREKSDKCLKPDNRIQLIYINPSSTSFTGLGAYNQKEALPADFYRYVSKILGGFVGTARTKEAYALAEENREVMGRMMISERSLPLASEHLMNFMGFFDRNFRIYDFYVGMYDGYRFAHETLTKLRDDQFRNGKKPEYDLFKGQTSKKSQWYPFACIRNIFETGRDDEGYCRKNVSGEEVDGKPADVDGINIQNFTKLLQIAFYQLYNQCYETGKFGFVGKKPSSHCTLAMKGNKPPQVYEQLPGTSLINNDGWKKRRWRITKEPRENDFEYLMRLLAASEYNFEQLEENLKGGTNIGREHEIKSKIRDLLTSYIRVYAHSLGPGTAPVKMLGKPLLNLIEPPKLILYLVIGQGSEFAASIRQRRAPYIRWNFATQIRGFDSIRNDTNAYINLGLALGPEAELNYWRHSPFVQFRLITRLGYQFVFTHNDGWDAAYLDEECKENAGTHKRMNYCSGFNMQGFLALSFFDRIRFQFGLAYLPGWIGGLAPDEGKGAITWMAEVGGQFLPASKKRIERKSGGRKSGGRTGKVE